MEEKKYTEVINFIKKQNSVFEAAKYFGGMDELKNLAKSNSELKKHIENSLRGYLTLKYQNITYSFDFEINAVDFDNVEDDVTFLSPTLNLLIKSNYLSDSGYEVIAKWVSSFCEDASVDYHFNDIFLSKYNQVLGYVDSVNGKKLDWGKSPLYKDIVTIEYDSIVVGLIKSLIKEQSDNIKISLLELKNLLREI
jgi:hypothetical protein